MNSFLNQGRCRVCGQMFCCREHQLEHERVAHDEYADWLHMLPILCRRCHRTITNVHDMKGKCILFNMKHTLAIKKPMDVIISTPINSERKRIISKVQETEDSSSSSEIELDATSLESRKKMTAIRRLKKQLSPIVVLNFNDIKTRNDIISTVFSPQFNITQNILSGDAKSSTPLYDEKENLPVIAIFDKADMSLYKTPPTIQSSSLVVVSALKKGSIIKDSNSNLVKKSHGRRVTFEVAKTPELEDSETSVYVTPEVEISNRSRFRRSADEKELTISFERVENDENSKVQISIYGTLESEPMVQDSDARPETGIDCTAVAGLVRNVKSAVTGLPRMIFNACGWSMRVIRKRKSDDISPVRSERQRRRPLKRRPISSHWVHFSGSSLRRRPLSAYHSIDDNDLQIDECSL